MTSEDSDPAAAASAPAPPAAAGPARPQVRFVLAVAATVLVLDQVTKALALALLTPGVAVPLLGPVLQLRLTFNPGAAFSLAEGYTIVLSLVAAGVAVVILRFSRRLGSRAWALALGALLGGALGNLGDRLFRQPGPLRGYVVDFLALPNFPIFNVADSCITGAAVLMVLLSLRGVEHDGGRSR